MRNFKATISISLCVSVMICLIGVNPSLAGNTPTVISNDLCSRVSQIKRLPFKEESPIEDAAYQALVDAGEGAFPCLIEKIADATPMDDPRGIPGPTDTRVGDVAYFVLVRMANLNFTEWLPAAVQKEYETEGVYAYHRYVGKRKNRLELQNKAREWHERKFGAKKANAQ